MSKITALKQYSKMLKKQLAYTAIIAALKPAALEELKQCKDGQAVVNDIEFNLSTSTQKTYPESIQVMIDGLTNETANQIAAIKNQAELSNQVETVSTKTLRATLPKSAKEKVLSKFADYRKYFGSNAA